MQPIKQILSTPVGGKQTPPSFSELLPERMIHEIFRYLDGSSRSSFSCLSRNDARCSLIRAQEECSQRVHELIQRHIDVLSTTPNLNTHPRNIQAARIQLENVLRSNFKFDSKFSLINKHLFSIRQSVVRALSQLETEDIDLLHGVMISLPSTADHTRISAEFDVVFDVAKIENMSTSEEKIQEANERILGLFPHNYQQALALAMALPFDEAKKTLIYNLLVQNNFDEATKLAKTLQKENDEENQLENIMRDMTYRLPVSAVLNFITTHVPRRRQDDFHEILSKWLAKKMDFEAALGVANRIFDKECREKLYSLIDSRKAEQQRVPYDSLRW